MSKDADFDSHKNATDDRIGNVHPPKSPVVAEFILKKSQKKRGRVWRYTSNGKKRTSTKRVMRVILSDEGKLVKLLRELSWWEYANVKTNGYASLVLQHWPLLGQSKPSPAASSHIMPGTKDYIAEYVEEHLDEFDIENKK